MSTRSKKRKQGTRKHRATRSRTYAVSDLFPSGPPPTAEDVFDAAIFRRYGGSDKRPGDMENDDLRREVARLRKEAASRESS